MHLTRFEGTNGVVIPVILCLFTKVIHFFNAPPSSRDEDLMEVFKKSNTADPVRVRLFPVKPGARSAAGLVEFEGVAEASEAMVLANHTIIPNPCKCSLFAPYLY